MKFPWGPVLVVIGVLIITIGGILHLQKKMDERPETRHEKLVFSATGCKVYQVTIRNEYGFDQIYVAVNPAASKRPTTAYPTCRIAH